MPLSPSFQPAWEAYQQAVDDLYETPAKVEVKRERAAGDVFAEQFEERGDNLLNRSAEVRTALQISLQTEDLAQRELATLKLLAAAAYDLAVVSDMMELDEVGPRTEGERGGRSAILAAKELMDILDAPLEDGLIGLLEVERAAAPSDPQAAREMLKETIGTFLEDIPEDAAKLSQKAVIGVVGLGLGPFQGAASVAAQEILAQVPAGLSIFARRAASLLVEAITKLRTAIGEKQEEWIRDKVGQWLDDVQEDRDTVAGLLDKLYETEKIKEEMTGLIEAAPTSTQAATYNQASQVLEELLVRYGKTRTTLEWVIRIVTFANAPLLGFVPWGPLAIYATYLSIFSYAIYSGGDYLDWYRTEEQQWLDRVQGLRTTVRLAVGKAPGPN